jgi:alkanesulfonate monooxygenase SsuD/methylene tetrahydromethanopterin reductase-like flavin-dependent oxidoreductase (luciferase family)
MKVGIILNNMQRTDADMVSALDEQIAMVRLARDKGWDSFLASMHYLTGGQDQELQQVPLLARLQADAGHMTMGVAIFLLALHNPVYAAETLATLDIIARGNFVCGIGLGYRPEEFDAFGVDMKLKVRRFIENLDVMKRLWSGEAVTHESDTCKLNNIRMNLRPVQRPHPPLWLAANHDNAVQRAARLGDCWYINPHATLDTIRRQMGIYRDALKEAGKPFPRELPFRKEIICAPTRRQALEWAAKYLGEKYRIYVTWGQDKVMPEGERLDLPFEELAQGRFIIGDPQDCYEQLLPWKQQLGVTHVVFRTHFNGMPISETLQSMRLISDELLPALHQL